MSTASITAGMRQVITGTTATGSVEFQLEQPAIVGSLTYGTNTPVPQPLINGEFASPVLLLTDAWWRITVQADAWRAQFTVFIPAETTAATLGQLFEMAAPPPVTPVFYVPRSLLGVPGGVATLDPTTGFILSGQLPPAAASLHPWDAAKTYAGLSDPDAVEDFFNDPENPFVGEAHTTYTNKRIICSSLTHAADFCEFVNCDITCTNSVFGVRLDANTGFEIGRRLRHCRITSAGVALSGAGFTATLCEVVYNGDDFARIGRSYAEKTVLELCYAHAFRPAVGAHCDGIQQLTRPGAGTRAWGCWIEMVTATGFTLDPTSGYTGAFFYDGPTDVPVPSNDAFPNWIGPVEINECRLVSEDNYTVVVQDNGADISNCMLLPGSTAIASITDNIIVTGHNNIDATGAPVASVDIAGSPLPRMVLPLLQDVLLSNPTDGQALAYDLTSKKWKNKTISGGGGGSGTAAKLYSTGWLSVTFGPGGGGQGLTPNTQMPTEYQLAIPGTEVSAGDLVSWRMGIISTGSDAQCDVASIVGGQPVNFYSGDYTPSQFEIGAGDLYQTGDYGHVQPVTIDWIVQETDLDPDTEGSFRLSLLYVPTGGNRIWGLGSQIGKVTMINYGQ